MFNFWVIDLGPLGVVKDMIIAFLSGSTVPIWFFPGVFKTIFSFLPFVYIYQFPISIYIGKASVPNALVGLLIQIFWAFLFFLLFLSVNKKAKRHLMIQGG
ncbi:MAG: hypothetical protein BGN88_13490 [Clostridiales bacterium 43-6]|nr:MAG: hypothetical protein BGN88_13490 [Clostridiales bacterium 43-6]